MNNLLILGSDFFQYGTKLKQAAQNIGYNAIFLKDIAEENFFFKFISRKFSALRPFLSLVFERNISKIIDANNISKVLIIRGEGLTYSSLKKLCEKYPTIEFVSYYWDSLSNMPNDSLKKAKLCRKAYTFDHKDFENNKSLSYMPLFYLKEKNSSEEVIYDVLFVGTAHSDRYKLIKKFKKKYSDKLKIYCYLYLENKMLYFFRKLFLGMYPGSHISEFNFTPLKDKTISELINKSKAIIDINRPDQSGSTIRSIQVLSKNKKLLTTNINLSKEHFYVKENIYFIDRANMDFNLSFLDSKFKINTQIKDQFVNNWLEELLK